MIKTISKYSLLLSILCITTSQVNPTKQQKQYTVTLPIEAWQAIMDVINKSNEEHLKVVAVQNLIIPQLQKQLADTTNKKK